MANSVRCLVGVAVLVFKLEEVIGTGLLDGVCLRFVVIECVNSYDGTF